MRGKGLSFSKGSNCLPVHKGQSLQQSQNNDNNNAATCRQQWPPTKQQIVLPVYPLNSSYWAGEQVTFTGPSLCDGYNIRLPEKISADLCQALCHDMIKQESGAKGVLVCHRRTVVLLSFICTGCSGSTSTYMFAGSWPRRTVKMQSFSSSSM